MYIYILIYSKCYYIHLIKHYAINKNIPLNLNIWLINTIIRLAQYMNTYVMFCKAVVSNLYFSLV